LWLTTYSGRGPERRAAASTPKDASSSGRWRRMPLVLRFARGGVVVVHLFEREVDHDHLEILSSVCCASALNKIGNRDTGYTKRHIRHRPGPARPDTVGSTRAPSNGMHAEPDEPRQLPGFVVSRARCSTPRRTPCARSAHMLPPLSHQQRLPHRCPLASTLRAPPCRCPLSRSHRCKACSSQLQGMLSSCLGHAASRRHASSRAATHTRRRHDP